MLIAGAALCPTVLSSAYGTADGESGAAIIAAGAARRWLARNAAGVKTVRSGKDAAALACTSLVLCLPPLERVELCLPGPLFTPELGCLLEALAWCPHLRTLSLSAGDHEGEQANVFPSFALAKLRSLTRLALHFGGADAYTLVHVVGALVSLSDLAELKLDVNTELIGSDVVPAALGQLKTLRVLQLHSLDSCRLEAGCFDLPNLLSLRFQDCDFDEEEVLPGISALQSLTSIEFIRGLGPRFFNAQLTQLPALKRVVFQQSCDFEALSELPADMGSLCSVLLYLDVSGQRLTQFPLALTQLVELKCLKAERNHFAELPAAIAALSRLTQLMLGRGPNWKDPLQLRAKRPLDVRALGNLSSFPALRKLSFEYCEVRMCNIVQGAVRHASLVSLVFRMAHPAPECALMVLRLSHALRGLRRGSVLTFVLLEDCPALQSAQGRAPLQRFMGALEACGL